jgi:squalene-hopene/tetraprenyl-beta-curcumene cyclase
MLPPPDVGSGEPSTPSSMRSQEVPMSSQVVARPAVPPVDVDRTIDAATQWLLSLQHDDGYWWAELESNVTITAEHLFLRHILGIPDDREAKKAAAYILSQQREDGTWGNWFDGPAELSTTVEAYAALKMAGISPDAPEMVRARSFILDRGGIEKVRVFTKIWFAMMGEWDWRGVPVLPVEFVLLPARFPMSIYAFGCWARQTIVPLAIVMAERPVVPLPQEHRLDELFVRGREDANLRVPVLKRTPRARFFQIADKLLRFYSNLPVQPGRRYALRTAEKWILERQEADGSWGGIQPPWVYSLIALKLRGHRLDDDGPLAKGFAGFYGETGFSIEDEETFHLQSCLSPVWDTGLALLALQDAELPSDHPALAQCAKWLLDEQIFTGGDWQVRCDARPGGWAFEFANDVYPDTDDTAVVMMGLLDTSADDGRMKHALERAEEWLIGMQSRNGGWGAFDRDNVRTWTRDIPFADFGEMIDPPSVDVTGHVVEILGRLGRRVGDPVVDRAVAYLVQEQEPDGAWYGRWGVNLTYGIGSVLPGLEAVGADMDSPHVRRAVDWLFAHQNDDGGWGERIEGYYAPDHRGQGQSTASQTAWALLGLLAAGEADHPAVRRGIECLVRTQNDSGGWDEEEFTGTGFPTDFMIRYHLYRDVFPVMALGRYRRAMRGHR